MIYTAVGAGAVCGQDGFGGFGGNVYKGRAAGSR
jgi:hypothetical protein